MAAIFRQFGVTTARAVAQGSSRAKVPPFGFVQGRKMSTTVDTIKTVGVVGLGSMGHGVAQLCAQAGYSVVVHDASEESLTNGLAHIEKSLKGAAAKKVKRGILDEQAANEEMEATLQRIEGSAHLGHVTDNADLVIEAIIENREIKQAFFQKLGEMCRPDAIIATNTSSFAVREMAQASGVADRVCGLHYFNPVQVMNLVEVIKSDDTSDAVIETVTDFVVKTGKTPVHCGDTPGFIVNRLLIPAVCQAVALLARGVATQEDIDTAMKLGAGHPMGPITLCDYVGNDVMLAGAKGWVEEYPNDPSFQVPEALELLQEMVDSNRLGRKTGKGFYMWEGNRPAGRA